MGPLPFPPVVFTVCYLPPSRLPPRTGWSISAEPELLPEKSPGVPAPTPTHRVVALHQHAKVSDCFIFIKMTTLVLHYFKNPPIILNSCHAPPVRPPPLEGSLDLVTHFSQTEHGKGDAVMSEIRLPRERSFRLGCSLTCSLQRR